MGNRSRAKWERRLERTAAEVQRTSPEEARRNRWSWRLAILGAWIGAFGLAYSSFAASPSFFVSIGAFVLGELIFAVTLIAYLDSEGARVLVIVGSLVLVLITWHWYKSAWEQKIDGDIQQGLIISLSNSSRDPEDSVIEVTNSSHTDLADHEVMCEVSALVIDGEPVMDDLVIETDGDIRKGPINVGGDSDVRGCLNSQKGPLMRMRGFDFPPNTRFCMDVVVHVKYTSVGFPSGSGEKRNRFVYGFSGNSAWTRGSNDKMPSYCDAAIYKKGSRSGNRP